MVFVNVKKRNEGVHEDYISMLETSLIQLKMTQLKKGWKCWHSCIAEFEKNSIGLAQVQDICHSSRFWQKVTWIDNVLSIKALWVLVGFEISAQFFLSRGRGILVLVLSRVGVSPQPGQRYPPPPRQDQDRGTSFHPPPERDMPRTGCGGGLTFSIVDNIT